MNANEARDNAIKYWSNHEEVKGIIDEIRESSNLGSRFLWAGVTEQNALGIADYLRFVGFDVAQKKGHQVGGGIGHALEIRW